MTQLPTGLAIAKPPKAEAPLIKMSLPVPLSMKPQEADTVDDLPSGSGWLYEQKFDGFRCLAFRDGETVALQSKKQKTLNRFFPELVVGLAGLQADRSVLDGEIIIPGQSFETLQLRLHPAASRITELSGKFPARLIVFDLLIDDSGSLMEKPFSERRAALKDFVKFVGQHRVVMLSETAKSRTEALKWLSDTKHRLDGIVAKPLDQPYLAGSRVMQKYKVWKSVDAVLGGYHLDEATGTPESLLFGLCDDDGLLHYIGPSGLYHEAAETSKLLEPLTGGSGFTGKRPGGKNRWTGKQQKFVPLEPRLVAELSADHITGGQFRHGSRLIRWRTDKAPEDWGIDQVR